MAAYISFQPTDFYKAQVYTGTGAENVQTFPQTTAMQPDFVWIKARSGSKSHRLFDAVRGVTKWIASDNTGAEGTTAESLKSFDSDGFTLGTYDHVNDNTVSFASWSWKMGTTTGLSGGTITPSGYSFNTTAGQSVITWTGTGSAGTIPHGLGIVPQFIIVKEYSDDLKWAVYNSTLGNTRYLILNTTAADGDTDNWNDTTPTSTVFSVGSASQTNNSGKTYVAYCFGNVKGYSHFARFKGNSNVDGTFVYTGFRPGYVLIKNVDSAGGSGLHWQVHSNAQSPHSNANSNMLQPEDAGGTTTWGTIDLVSNGFKIRTTNYATNYTNTIIYAAFAEFPIVSSNSKAGTAN